MLNLMFEPLRKYAVFQGRARRSEYWMYVLLLFILEMVIWLIGSALGMNFDATTGRLGGGLMIVFPLFSILGLVTLLPSLAVSVRRLHDTDKSGWFLLLALIPLLGGLVLLIFMVLDGTPGPNRFGPDPKGRELLTGGSGGYAPSYAGAPPTAPTETL